MNIIEDKQFSRVNFSEAPPARGQYENCTFRGCRFVACRLSDIVFIDCEFYDCDFSGADISGAGWQNIRFEDCRLQGIAWERAIAFLFEIHCHRCNLNHCSFYGMVLKNCTFEQCDIQESDFSLSDARGTSFTGSDLSGTTFSSTKLDKADFRRCRAFSINPTSNSVKGAHFSAAHLEGLLSDFGINISYE